MFIDNLFNKKKYNYDINSQYQIIFFLFIYLFRFQAKGMDIGVTDDALNGIHYERSSDSEDEIEEEETEG